MERFHFKMYYAAGPSLPTDVFFEAFFDAPSIEVAQQFGHKLSKLYQENGLINEAYKVYSHNVYPA